MKTFVRFAVSVMVLTALLVAGIATRPADAGKPTPPPPPPPMPIDYVLTWLPAPDGVANTKATSSNASGIVVGNYGLANNQYESRACIWTPQGVLPLHNLATVPDGWVLVSAMGINDAGQIAGSAVRLADRLVRAYRFDPATDTTPAQVTLLGDPTSAASHEIANNRPINRLGDVAYNVPRNDGTYTRDSYVRTVSGQVFQTQGSFNSIGDNRQLIGGNRRWTLATGQVEAFSTSIRGADINLHGHFVGDLISKNRSYAMRYQSSAQTIGPDSSYASGINSSGDVVGSVSYTGVGFIFTDTYGYVDVDTLVVAANAADQDLWDSAIRIVPSKITNHASGEFGDIAGTAYFEGDVYQGFILTPVPAP